MPRPEYHPPPLDILVTLINPSERPGGTRSRYGLVIPEADYGVEAWAGRRDRTPETLSEGGELIYVLNTVWTIRYRTDLDANVEVHYGEQVFRAVGPAVLRGGPAFGRRTKYLEIHTELRR